MVLLTQMLGLDLVTLCFLINKNKKASCYSEQFLVLF